MRNFYIMSYKEKAITTKLTLFFFNNREKKEDKI